MQASIVQWPELCGRGANSLTSSVPSRRHEHLDGQHADQVERACDPPADRRGLFGQRRCDRRRCDRSPQDVVLVDVLDRHVDGHRAIDAAGDNHRDFLIEIDPAFEDTGALAGGAGHRLPGAGKIGRLADRHLTLAVVAVARRLEHRRPADVRQRRRQRLWRRDRPPRCRRHAAAVEEGLLDEPVLAGGEDGGTGAQRHQLVDDGGGAGGNVLELVGDDVDGGGERLQGRLIAVVGDGRAVGDVGGRRVGVRGSRRGSGSRVRRRRAPASGQADRRRECRSTEPGGRGRCDNAVLPVRPAGRAVRPRRRSAAPASRRGRRRGAHRSAPARRRPAARR